MSSTTSSLSIPIQPVDSVTIYVSSTVAEITRKYTSTNLKLKKGSYIFKFLDIPGKIDPKSLRLHGLENTVHVVDISSGTNVDNGLSSQERTGNQIVSAEALVKKCKCLEAELDVHKTESRLLDHVSSQFLANDKSMTFESFMKVVERKRNAMQEIIRIDAEIASLDEEIQQLESSNKDKTSTIVATLVVEDACNQDKFKLTYLVDTGVTCCPYYDLYASTSEFDGRPTSHASLNYYADIAQNTSEDWNNTVLTLSIANPCGLDSLTVLPVQRLDLFPRIIRKALPTVLPKPSCQNRITQFSATVPLAFFVQAEQAFTIGSTPSYTPPPPSEGPDAIRKPHALAYVVQDRVSLPGDGLAHKVFIAAFDLPATMTRVVALDPEKPMTVLQGWIMNTSQYCLPAGPISVFMDDSLVSKTEFSSALEANSTFTFSLGVDPNIIVSRNTDFTHSKHQETDGMMVTIGRTCVTTSVVNKNIRGSPDIPIAVLNQVVVHRNDGGIDVGGLLLNGLTNARNKAADALKVNVEFEFKFGNLHGPTNSHLPKVRWISRNITANAEEGMYQWQYMSQAGSTMTLFDIWKAEVRADM